MSFSPLDLGIPGLRPLDGLDAERWERAARWSQRGPFLRSEGVSVALGPPQQLDRAVTDQARRLVREFDGFGRGLIERYRDDTSSRDDYLVNPQFEALVDIDIDCPIPFPLARLDCVLDRHGRLVVVEINAVGVCIYHYRNVFYLIRALERAGAESAAVRTDGMVGALATSLRAYYRARAASPVDDPVVGALVAPRSMRMGRVAFAAGLRRHGLESVWGTAAELEIDGRGATLKGRPVDLLWTDLHFYMAYQSARYQQTVFPTRVGAYEECPAEVEHIFRETPFLELVRAGTVVNIGPGGAYLGLPKPLLSRVHHAERPAGAWLQEHVARTYSVHERQNGVLGVEEAKRRREELVAKPALYGGSHGVTLGRTVSESAWNALVDEVWAAADWAFQEVSEPIQTGQGEFISLGLSSFGGRFGGALLRSAPGLSVNARDARFAVALPADSD